MKLLTHPARSLAIVAAIALGACSTTATQTLVAVDPGAYTLDKAHGSIVWRVKHQGLSWYTGRLTDFEANLDFDPENPTASSVQAIINPNSVSAEHPEDSEWDARIGEEFFQSETFPQIVFQSTSATPTGEFEGQVTGDLTFMGVTKPVTLDVTYNGAINASPLHRGKGLLGFSARGVINRSDFGLDQYSSFVGDEVEIIIEVEFVEAG